MPDDWRGPATGPLPDYVTKPLLTRITEGSLDADYLMVAQRRSAERASAAGGTPRGGPSRPHLTAAAVIAVFGVLVTTAAVQTSRNADVTDAGRTTLIARVTAEREEVAAQQQQIADLQDDNIGAEADLADLTVAHQDELARLRRLEVATGFVAVRGDGVKVTIADPPNADATELVQDVDLARLVDGLWRAGAEAIAINGQRLTVLSAIRTSGVAINVNSRPITPPYIVSAIGDQATLQANLLDSTHGSRFFDVADQLGFGVAMQNEDDLVLPAARGPRLVSVARGISGKPGMDNSEEANP